MSDEPRNDWKEDCLRWHGRVLTGKYGHWCPEWDFLPVDDTCHEWPCGCELRLENGKVSGP